MSANIGESYNEQILQATIDGTPYENENPCPSRIEVLLMELKEVIEAGSVVVDQTYSAESTNAQAGTAVAQAVSGKADLVNGTVPISQIPPAAIERMITVQDDTARFALTTDDVQPGDTVKVVSTNKMYLVIDDAHLDTEAGYSVYVAGRAAEAVADQYGNIIDTTYATKATTKTAWEGTAAQYAALTSDDYDLYFVEEST